MEAWRW